MATATVKVFHSNRNFGFLTTEDGTDLYVHGDSVSGDLDTGAIVEYELEGEGKEKQAVDVSVVTDAPESAPIGRTMAAPPTWDVLEERERKRRAQRRRRR